jgi:hypothetical protein
MFAASLFLISPLGAACCLALHAKEEAPYSFSYIITLFAINFQTYRKQYNKVYRSLMS